MRTRTDPQATAVVYYSGHGGVENDSYYLIPADANRMNISATSLPIVELEDRLAKIQVPQLVLFLDCCHAARTTLKGTDLTPPLPFKAKAPSLQDMRIASNEGRAIIASSTASQSSYILGGHSNSLFTEVLLGLWNQLGEIEILNLFPALRDEVTRRAAAAGCEQTPRFSAKNAGRIVLGHPWPNGR